MNRREAVKQAAFLMGGALSATTLAVFLDSCHISSTKDTSKLFTAPHLELVTEVADSIIPTTRSSPGAKAAGVGAFIVLMIKDCYPEEAQQIFIKGLNELEEQAKILFKKPFAGLSAEYRIELLSSLREKTIAEQNAEHTVVSKQEAALGRLPAENRNDKPRFFAMMRDLTVLGYFTSEIGATKAMSYVHIPGRYDGCVDLKGGQKAWA